MSIITLTTDWGYKDFYLGAVKGSILSRLPEVTLVDISHDVDTHDIIQASLILKNAFHHFPKGSVHIIGVASQKEREASHLAVRYKDHYFIGADNGIFALVMDDDPQMIVEIGNDKVESPFPVLDVFVEVACKLASGASLNELGPIKTSFWERVMLRPSFENNTLRGNVIYIDKFGNLITNIKKEMFETAGKGRAFTLYSKKSEYELSGLSSSYSNAEDGQIIVLINTQGLLEIAISKGLADKLLGLRFNDAILIEFQDL